MFDVEGGDAALLGALDEAAGVVGVAAADDDEDVDLFEQAFEGGLAVFGGLADGVDEADEGVGVEAADLIEDGAGFAFGRGGLGDEAEFGVGEGAGV